MIRSRLSQGMLAKGFQRIVEHFLEEHLWITQESLHRKESIQTQDSLVNVLHNQENVQPDQTKRSQKILKQKRIKFFGISSKKSLH